MKSNTETLFQEFIDSATDPDPPHNRFAREGLLAEKIATRIDAIAIQREAFFDRKALGGSCVGHGGVHTTDYETGEKLIFDPIKEHSFLEIMRIEQISGMNNDD